MLAWMSDPGVVLTVSLVAIVLSVVGIALSDGRGH